MSARAKIILCTFIMVVVGLLGGYVAFTWSVPGEALVFRYTGTRVLPVTEKGATKDIQEFLLVIDFEVENHHAIGIHLWEAQLLRGKPPASGPGDPTMLMLTMTSGSNYLGNILPRVSDSDTAQVLTIPFPEPPPVPAHGVMRYSAITTRHATAAFDLSKAHVAYTWRTATKHRAAQWYFWCRSFLPEKFRDRFTIPGYKMDVTPVATDPFDIMPTPSSSAP